MHHTPLGGSCSPVKSNATRSDWSSRVGDRWAERDRDVLSVEEFDLRAIVSMYHEMTAMFDPQTHCIGSMGADRDELRRMGDRGKWYHMCNLWPASGDGNWLSGSDGRGR
jgi:hypothetical protein